ncbi:TetR/AcrR family transcriptional regulator [Aquidulcibacter sp.]|uniref:TetR/AcrR family transcriptional regulator n=1 Tax=Aquidulcibacter sp. TaxID=2052990 RepID=UPI0025B84580|nr:TetR/AcrR family transcriptional regulator [Aquidulcibacter sp.]MCA3697943.1 TetR/AcrR family transcriptional regulator [Aquidulcibacter sp.]
MPNAKLDSLHGKRRDLILDAAESLVMTLGAAHLTMDAVAARAEVSKGGVLHHFPTKAALIQAMLDRLLAIFEADLDVVARASGTSFKAQLRAWINLTQTIDVRLDRICAALLSASANDPELLKPFAVMMQDRLKRYQLGHPSDGLVSVVFTALDGYWLFNALGLSPLSESSKSAFFSALLELVDGLDEATMSSN